MHLCSVRKNLYLGVPTTTILISVEVIKELKIIESVCLPTFFDGIMTHDEYIKYIVNKQFITIISKLQLNRRAQINKKENFIKKNYKREQSNKHR